ncbi:hypothetical protein FBU30_000604 [Linnemannia zychae]|nr:hypothetical protein FBU30_000604 [Linnemannia zychae]
MLPPPSINFFQLPEMASLLSSFLRASDISNLMQTSRAMHSLFHPCFWYHLELISEEQVIRLISSREGFEALVANFNRIRSLKMTLAFLCYHYVAVLEYLDTHDSPPDAIQSSLLNPNWHSPPRYRSHLKDVQPLLPFTQLSRLDVNLVNVYGGRYISFAVNMYNQSPLALTVSWMFGLNPGLTDVCIRGIELQTDMTTRVLARSISRLRHLKHLELIYNEASPFHPAFFDVAKIFLSLPPSIISFKWKDEVKHFAPFLPGYTMTPESPDFSEGPVIERSEPLLNLTTLELPMDSRGYLHNQLKLIFRHCPMITSLQFPFVNPDDVDRNAVVDYIKVDCPKIRHIFIDKQHKDGFGHCVFGVSENLPRNQLETLHFTGIQDEFPGRLAIAAINHSKSLQKIVMKEAILLQSRGIQEILVNCIALEHLEISGRRPSTISINLVDAVAAQWACTNLRYLSLIVYLGGYSRVKTEQEEEQKRWTTLEAFYRQLGMLTKLEVLDLQSSATASFNGRSNLDPLTTSRIFPRLLILDDKTTNKRGYLGMLGGLKRLRILRGSVRIDAREWSYDSETIGQPEVEWIVDHWKNLRLITLLPDNHDRIPNSYTPECLQWLQTHMPELKLCRHFAARFYAGPVVDLRRSPSTKATANGPQTLFDEEVRPPSPAAVIPTTGASITPMTLNITSPVPAH